MKTRVTILWDANDPFPMGKRIEEAFNRVVAFCPELTAKVKHPVLTAFNRVIGGEFESEDLTVLVGYSSVVFSRAYEKHGNGSKDVVSLGVMQAAANLVGVMSDTVTYVTKEMTV